jgi:hypothetical protein
VFCNSDILKIIVVLDANLLIFQYGESVFLKDGCVGHVKSMLVKSTRLDVGWRWMQMSSIG